MPLLILVLIAAQAVPGQGPTITYTISLQGDGSAIWSMEYRTPLLTQDDIASFQNYSAQIQTVYLSDYTELMEKSAADASAATGRAVGVSDFSADSSVQSGPTGSYGVVHYRCVWSGFAAPGDPLTVGDVFVGGLYLGKDDTLIIRPPPGYEVEDASPQPDQTQDGLSWYGLRSFGAGEPRVVFVREPFPWIPVLAVVGMAGLVAAGIYAYRRRSSPPVTGTPVAPAPGPRDSGASLGLEEPDPGPPPGERGVGLPARDRGGARPPQVDGERGGQPAQRGGPDREGQEGAGEPHPARAGRRD